MSKFSHFLRLLLVSRSIMMISAKAKYSAKMHGEMHDWMMLMFLLAAVHFAAELGSSDGPGNEKHTDDEQEIRRNLSCRAHTDPG